MTVQLGVRYAPRRPGPDSDAAEPAGQLECRTVGPRLPAWPATVTVAQPSGTVTITAAEVIMMTNDHSNAADDHDGPGAAAGRESQ